jgi:hypothetical protein
VRVLLVIAAIVCIAADAVAQGDPAGAGIDLAIVVDRSGSMTGSGRPEADLLLRLALELLARNAEALRLNHRFGVMTFGSAARVDVPLTPLLEGGAARLRRTLGPLTFMRNLGNTDVLCALLAARQLFRALSPDPFRRHVLLLITDGVPYVPRANAAAYARELRRFLATSGADDPILEVLLLPARSARDEQLWREVSRDRLHFLEDDAYLSLYRVVSGIVGTRSLEMSGSGGDTLVIPPYLDTVVFDVFRGRPPGEIAIFAPDALRPLDTGAEGVAEVRTGELLSTVVVRRPAPGRWTFRKSRPDSRVRLFSQQFFPRGLLVHPEGPALRQYDRVAVAYRVTDAGGAPLRDLPGYPLQLELTLSAPNGRRRRLGMLRDATRGDGVFRTIDETECDVAGIYWTEVEVRTRDADDRPVNVFCDRWSGFRVAPATRIDCRVTSSGSSSFFSAPRFLWDASLAIRLNCFDGQERPADLQALSRGSPARLFRPSLWRDGRASAATLDLHYLGRGVFDGWLHGFGGAGTYRLQLAVDQTHLAPTYNIRFLPASTIALRRSGWIDRAMFVAAILAAIPLLLLSVRRPARSS